MIVEEGQEKKRRSRFDMLPPDPQLFQPNLTTVAPIDNAMTIGHNPNDYNTSYTATMMVDPTHTDDWHHQSAQLPATESSTLPNFLQAALANITRVGLEVNSIDGQTSYVSVIDSKFKSRLERAMDKNLAYIERKDREELEFIANGGKLSESNSSIKAHSYGMPFRVQEKAGIGANPTPVEAKVTKTEPVSVYVNNLPTDISEEEIDILFAPQGKIKKIKLYLDDNGNKKGDCLVTFASADSAVLACLKLNKLDIGDGHVISVTKADFGNKVSNVPEKQQQLQQSFVKAETTPATNKDDPIHFRKASTGLHTVDMTLQHQPLPVLSDAQSKKEILQYIPAECEPEKHALVIIFNAYDAERADNDDAYVEGIETDILLLCCNHGKINFIQLFQAPPTSVWPLVSSATKPHGCVAVSFDCASAASNCATAVNGSTFNGDVLRTDLLLPSSLQLSDPEPAEYLNSEAKVSHNHQVVLAEQVNPQQVDDATVNSAYLAEAESTEDFLNSLL